MLDELPSPKAPTLMGVPACQGCGRRDHTLRKVRYPFVISLVAITFRRGFDGLWCQRCRNLRWLVAGLVTSLFGWLGIPFGFIFTPLTLWKLAHGGEQFEAENASLLRQLAAFKELSGDLTGARLCLESSLRFQDDPQARSQLLRFYASCQPSPSPFSQPGWLAINLPLLGLLCVALIFGGAIGLGDFYLSRLISTLIGENANILIAILSWTPIVGLCIFALLLLSMLLETSLILAGNTRGFPAEVIALLSGALLIYGLPEGIAIGTYLEWIRLGYTFQSGFDLIVSSVAVLVRGGVLEIVEALQSGSLSSTIYLILLAGLGLFCLYSLQTVARQVSSWQARLAVLKAQIRGGDQQPQGSPLWIAAASLGIVFGLVMSFPQNGIVDYLQAVSIFRDTSVLLQQGDYQSAAVQLEEAVRLRPTMVEGHENLGYAYLFSGNPAQSQQQFQQVIALQPESPYGYLGLGRTYYEQGHLEEAAVAWEQALTLQPEMPDTLIGLGNIYYQLDQIDQAETAYRQVLQKDPQAIDALLGLGDVALQSEDYAAAEQAYRQALQIDAQSSAAKAGLGQVYFQKNQLERAISELEMAVKLDSQNSSADVLLIYAYLKVANFDKSIQTAENLIDLNPDWSVAYALAAVAYYEHGDEQKAVQMMQSAEERGKGDPFTLYILGGLYDSMNQLDKAESLLLASAGLWKDSEQPYLDLSTIYSQKGQFDQALSACQKAEELAPGKAEPVIYRGFVYLDQGDFSRAKELMQRAESLEPDLSDAHAALSLVALAQGKPNLALSETEEAIRIDPYNGSAQTYRSIAYHMLGQKSQALDAAESAVKITPQRDLPHYALGMALLDIGQKERAKAELQLFLKHYWDRAYAQPFKLQAEQALFELNGQ